LKFPESDLREFEDREEFEYLAKIIENVRRTIVEARGKRFAACILTDNGKLLPMRSARLKSLKQQGLIVERVLDRSTFIFDSSLEACALCRHYGTGGCKYDPNREGFVEPLDRPPKDGCFEPLGGE
jgi:hypothetical protein